MKKVTFIAEGRKEANLLLRNGWTIVELITDSDSLYVALELENAIKCDCGFETDGRCKKCFETGFIKCDG